MEKNVYNIYWVSGEVVGLGHHALGALHGRQQLALPLGRPLPRPPQSQLLAQLGHLRGSARHPATATTTEDASIAATTTAAATTTTAATNTTTTTIAARKDCSGARGEEARCPRLFAGSEHAQTSRLPSAAAGAAACAAACVDASV